MNVFLSCDWGTSTLRLNLVNGYDGSIIAHEKSDLGIAKTFALWNATDSANKNSRVSFYLDVLQDHIRNMERKLNTSLSWVKLFISGMASSTIGIIELPYSELPFALSGAGFNMTQLPVQEDFDHEVILISGVKTMIDVMRGEESQLIGCMEAIEDSSKPQLFIFPGTHSKHIYVSDNTITSFKTYMTGDFFELLSQKSILHNSVEKESTLDDPDCLTSFKQGVNDSINSNLLNGAFRVRTNSLFDIYNKKQNFTYLSGLLIGTELKELIISNAETIHLICGTGLEKYYRTAFEELKLSKQIKTYLPQWVDEAVIRAHHTIYSQINNSYEK
ncbi:MAG: 2-dehydro-3-deoxygalactonokinase [Mucilaginibacter sp.]|uniref:2-dehydro-3-deoxygalactonokinase n=1 Tax=Mucilaginibacter sp. TaxID=1882438 RepID=UPI0031B2FDF9